MATNDMHDLMQRAYERIGLREVHQLEVQQVELELQNEQLEAARAWIEVALASYTELFDAAPVPYFTLSRDGEIVETNRAGAMLFGASQESLAERSMARFVAASDRLRVQAVLQHAHAQGVVGQFELLNGRTVEMHMAATRGNDVRRVVLIDVSERVASTRRAQRQAQAFTLAREAMCILGPGDVVEEINPALARLLGAAAGHAIGMKFAALLEAHPALVQEGGQSGPVRRLR